MSEEILDTGFSAPASEIKHAKFAGFWIRVAAAIVDFIVLLPILGLSTYNLLVIKSMPLMLLLSVIGMLYKPYLEWKKSATLGKMAVGIRLVDGSMNNISLEHAIKRYIPWIINYGISMLTNFMMFTMPEFQAVESYLELGPIMQNTPFYIINNIYSFVFFIIVVSVAFDARKQGLHDKFAKTYCIVDSK